MGPRLRRRRQEGATAVEFTFAAKASAAAEARVAVRGVLIGWGLEVISDSATLLCSELVTNAVRHAGTRIRICLDQLPDGGVRVSVADGGRAGPPQLTAPVNDAEGGRGLWLVDRLANSWGTIPNRRGKTVWFELLAREPLPD